MSGDRVEYEPPRVEVIGTIEQLTMGFSIPDSPDNSTTFGTTISDRRLKEESAGVDPHEALERVGAGRW